MADVEIDEAQEDFDREHRYAQAALRRKHVDLPEGKIMRYQSTYDEPDEYTCDCVWVDRLTGDVVRRYDAADPANTNSYYGAVGDVEAFERKGLNIYERIDEKDAKPMPTFSRYDSGGYDDYDD